jgi:hypothetical protein
MAAAEFNGKYARSPEHLPESVPDQHRQHGGKHLGPGLVHGTPAGPHQSSTSTAHLAADAIGCGRFGH